MPFEKILGTVALPRGLKSILMVAIIAGAAIAFALASYDRSSDLIRQTTFVAANDARSNANIQAHDLAALVSEQLKHVDDNLQSIASFQTVQNGDVSGSAQLFVSAQNSTSQVADVYTWLDKDGKVFWASNFGNTSNYHRFVGLDLSYRDYFKVPRDSQAPYYSPYYLGIDGAPRVNIAYPIFSESNGIRDFTGVVTSSINLRYLGNFVQSNLAGNYQSQVGLIDTNGTILYSSNSPQYVGQNIFGQKVQSLIPQEIRQPFDKFVHDSLRGNAGSGDFGTQNNTSTIAYSPVSVNRSTIAVLYIVTPHQLAGDVIALIDQQRLFNLFISLSIGIIAVALVAIIVTWNRRLSETVKTQTSQLKSYSQSLEDSNKQLQESNQRLAEANEQLTIKDKLQSEFVNIAAHELRTPIQPLLGIAETLHEQAKANDRKIEIAKPELEMLMRNAKRLERLSEDILQVARIDSGAFKTNMQNFNLDEIIDAAISDLLSDPNLDPDVQVIHAPATLIVHADKEKTLEVISNLLANAAKFTKKGTISITARQRDSGWIEVTVADTGTGIDPVIAPKLFEKFVTNSRQGTGLGLYICKKIIEAHGGTIQGRNRSDGAGAEFVFSLPLAKSQLTPPSSEVQQN